MLKPAATVARLGTMRSSLNWTMIVGGLFLLSAVLVAATFRTAQGEMLVRYTVRLALAWYTAALLVMMRLRSHDWPAASTLGQVARWCWTWGIVCFVIHLG